MAATVLKYQWRGRLEVTRVRSARGACVGSGGCCGQMSVWRCKRCSSIFVLGYTDWYAFVGGRRYLIGPTSAPHSLRGLATAAAPSRSELFTEPSDMLPSAEMESLMPKLRSRELGRAIELVLAAWVVGCAAVMCEWGSPQLHVARSRPSCEVDSHKSPPA